MKHVQIAIDGPVAAGKGTVSRLVAERLGFLYVDTGAMYRVAALLALRAGVSWSDEERIAHLIREAKIAMRNPVEEERDGRQTTVLVNGEDVSWAIRTEEISRGSSAVAKHPQVRLELVKKQQAIARVQDVVMEGRDITFRVLPEAQLKIYLTADEAERARRRHEQLLERGQDVSYQEVLQELKDRDTQDMSRSVDPLHKTDDAWELDTSSMEIAEVVETVAAKVRELQAVEVE
jgi:CMP/dCMP kinase